MAKQAALFRGPRPVVSGERRAMPKPSPGTQGPPPAGVPQLPRGKAAVTLLVDAEGRPTKWHIAFDPKSFRHAQEGDRVSESAMRFRVMHVLGVLRSIVKELSRVGIRAVYAGKGDGDRLEVCIWKGPKNPLTTCLDVAGWWIHVTEVEAGRQCVRGFELPAVIDDLAEFAEGVS